MNLPFTLYRYIAKHFLLSLLLALFGLIMVITLVDVIELLRRASGKESIPFGVILQMTTLKIPYLSERMLPFASLIGGMLTLAKLTRSQELIIARASGVSVWQFLLPIIGVAACVGIGTTTLLNPLSARMLTHQERLEGRYLKGRPSALSLSPSGLWLRQVEHHQGDIGEHIIYAQHLSPQDMSFGGVVVYRFDTKGHFKERLDAKRAVLVPGSLELEEVIRSEPGEPSQTISSIAIPTGLTLEYIQDSFASPETMSFWHLPSFISMLEAAGFSALRHRLYWNGLLALPVLLVGMVLIAAIFSLRLPRRGKIGALAVAGLACGFGLHFFTNIITSLGAAGTLPVFLAAWAPAVAALFIGCGALLHLEDG